MAWTRFRKKRDMPEGVWVKCPSCGKTLYQKDLHDNFHVCGECSHHFRMGARERVTSLVDPGSFKELHADLYTVDRLEFTDDVPYSEKVRRSAKKTGSPEAAMAGTATIRTRPVSLCVLDFHFMGGSMGAVVGEKVTRTVELAAEERLPAVIVSCSGGARMHEGMISLMQMAKTSAALSRLDALGGLAISVLCNPTTGGVMASYAALGDVILAEPRALIGFAGPRVIQETLRTELPEGFQTAEFLLERGFVDRIVERKDLPATIGLLIDTLWTYTPEQLERYAPPPLPEEPESGENGEGERGEEDSPEAVPETPEAVAARERKDAPVAGADAVGDADDAPPEAEADASA